MQRERGFATNTATTTTTHQVPAIQRNPARNKPDFTPGPSNSLECTIEGVRNLWCAICNRWTLTHTTTGHVRRPNRSNSKAPNTAAVPNNNTQRAHLAYGTTYETERFESEHIDDHADF